MTALATNQQSTNRDPWPDWAGSLLAELKDASVDDLMTAFQAALTMTRDALMRAAVIVRLAEERGVQVEKLGYPTLLPMLKRIAYGQMLPEVAATFRGSSLVMSKVSALPLDDQHKIAADEPLPVVEQTENGWTHRLVRPSQLNPSQAHQVFASDHVRDQGEQRSLLEARVGRDPVVKSSRPAIYIDDKRRVLVITEPTTLTAKQLMQFAASLSER